MPVSQRLTMFVLLGALVGALFIFPPTNPRLNSEEMSAILVSAMLLVSFSALLLEHFFTRPMDVIAAGVSILLLLIPSRTLLAPWGMWYWIFGGYESIAVLLATLALLLLTDRQATSSRRNRVSAILKTLTTRIASGKAQYFFLSLLTVIFFVEPRTTAWVAFLLYGIFVMLFQPQTLFFRFPKIARNGDPEVGRILSVQGNNTFLVRLYPGDARPPLRLGDLLEFSYGMDEPRRIRRAIVLERFFLDQAQWVRALCHEEIDAQSTDLVHFSEHQTDAVYKRADRHVGEFLEVLVGVVQDGTDIGTLRFLQAGEIAAQEGDLIQVTLPEGPVLYQVVNGHVDTESLESRNETDFVVGEAVQLGLWDQARGGFERFGWVPAARTPVMRANLTTLPVPSDDEIDLGKIPGTDFPVLLSKSEAISHHTAILGVTGVGKSVFARNLIKEFSKDETLRVIVVDFTREWKDHMKHVGVTTIISEDDGAPLRKAIDDIATETSKFKSQQDANIIRDKKKILFDGFLDSLSGFLQGSDSVGIFELPDLSNTEGVLEYTQWFFKTLFYIARESESFGKSVCIVLEEAHTVIPEWNFIGLSDKSSQTLVNNISQIALQGRKYGVGFIVIAQRTATVSKTVLTQCNTIVAFQCFDGTSIEFLSHYLPKSVAEAVPNLRFKRAVAVGKAIRGAVPLMFDVAGNRRDPRIPSRSSPELGVQPYTVIRSGFSGSTTHSSSER